MITPKELLSYLSPFQNKYSLVVYRQTTNDLIDYILEYHNEFESEYDKIYKFFDTGNTKTTAKGIYDFCKKYLKYDAEPGRSQTVKSPAAILQPGAQIDCKHYSLFAGGILDAIKRNEQPNLNWWYRFASYDSNPDVQHVFVCVKDHGTEYWIDPIPEIDYFDQKRTPTYIIDEKPMALYKVSGIPQGGHVSISADSNGSFDAFIYMLKHNAFGFKDLLTQNQAITNSDLKNYCRANGFDFNQVLAALQ